MLSTSLKSVEGLECRAQEAPTFRLKRRSSAIGLYYSEGGFMDTATVLEYLQSLIVLAVFIMILAAGFKVWRWNYVVPPR